jgi:hypothetical protein
VEGSDSSEEPVEENGGETAESEATVEPAIQASELGADATLAALLTADHKERLMKALLSSDETTEGDEELIELVKDFDDPRLLPYLVSQLRRTEDNPPKATYNIVRVVAELLNNKRITALAESYRDARNYDEDDEDDEDVNENHGTAKTRSSLARERSAQMRLFLQQVDRFMRGRNFSAEKK